METEKRKKLLTEQAERVAKERKKKEERPEDVFNRSGKKRLRNMAQNLIKQ